MNHQYDTGKKEESHTGMHSLQIRAKLILIGNKSRNMKKGMLTAILTRGVFPSVPVIVLFYK